MCGGRDQRHHPDLIGWCLVVVALLSACSRSNPTDELLTQATSSLRRGDYNAAQTLAEKGLNATADQTPSYWKLRLVQAEAFINLGRARDVLPLLETQPPSGSAYSEVACRARIVRAKALFRLGRSADATTALDEAEALAAAARLQHLLPEIRIFRYALFETTNQPQKAEAALQDALKLAQEQKDPYWETLALNNLGYSRLRRSRYDEALAFLTRAEQGFLKFDARMLASAAQVNIAACARLLGDFDRALASYNSAIEIQEREGAKPFLQASLGEVGSLYMYREDFAKAIPYYQRALALATEINSSDASKWAGNLASAMTNLGNWDQAEKFNEQSRELKQRINDVDSQINTRLYSAVIAAGRGQNEVAEGLFRRVIQEAANKPSILWEAHAGLARLYRSMGNPRKTSDHFESAIRVIEASRAELTLPDNRITFLARLMNFYQSYVDALIEQKNVDKALQIADSSRARVLGERLGDRSLRATTKAGLQSKGIVLSYWLAPQRSFLWVITPREKRLFTLPPKKEIESLVDSYLRFIGELRDPLETDSAGQRLYEILLQPVMTLIPSGSTVTLVPDGALHNLNFEMLPVPGTTPHYWIEDVVLSVAPSLVAGGSNADSVPALKSVLLIGNPESVGETFPKLPNASDEMRSVERRLGSLQKTVYEGVQAEPGIYRTAKPEQFSVIHFTAHATANSSSPMESAIVLSPAGNTFKLYARDVAQVPLQAELVTISACRGAGARVYSGEGLVGFTWAFLQAGARHVIAGLWDVTDASTAQLMDSLYENLSASMSPPRALREAKLKMIRSQGPFRKPYYWAPFQVYIGGPRA